MTANPYKSPAKVDDPSPSDKEVNHSTDEPDPRALQSVAWMGGWLGSLVWLLLTKYAGLPELPRFLDFLLGAACFAVAMLLQWLFLRMRHTKTSVRALTPIVVILVYFTIAEITHYLSAEWAVKLALFLTIYIYYFDRLVLQKRSHAKSEILRRKKLVDKRMKKRESPDRPIAKHQD